MARNLITSILVILTIIGFSWELAQVLGDVGDCPTSCPDSNVVCLKHGPSCTIYGDFCAHCADKTMYFRVSKHEEETWTPVQCQEEALCPPGCLCYHASVQKPCGDLYDWELWCGMPEYVGSNMKDAGTVYCPAE